MKWWKTSETRPSLDFVHAVPVKVLMAVGCRILEQLWADHASSQLGNDKGTTEPFEDNPMTRGVLMMMALEKLTKKLENQMWRQPKVMKPKCRRSSGTNGQLITLTLWTEARLR